MSPARFVGSILTLALPIALTACTSAPKPAAAPMRPSIEAALTPAENLARFAEYESALAPASPPVVVELPPGVDPDALALRPENDARARQDLAATISELAVSADWESRIGLNDALAQMPMATELDAETRDKALSHYIRGREAAMQNRHLVATNELQQAHELDPTSPAIMRELARNLLAIGNQPRALELYARLLAIDAQDSEAIFTLALAAANRREFDLAAETLARRYVVDHSFGHDPAADLLARFTLSSALRHLGYDFASIEAGVHATEVCPEWIDQSIYGQRVGSVYRQRGETWRHIGDAWCRLGMFRKALDAYAASARLPSSDPASLHPRVVYANLCLGYPYSAQHELLQAIRNESPAVSDRDIRLCSYLASNSPDVTLMADAVLRLQAHTPDSSSLARAAASLVSRDQARTILRDFVDRQPRDQEVAAELFAWLGEQDPAAAVDLAVALVNDHPDLANTYTRRLLFAVPQPARLLAAVQRHARLPAGIQVQARLLTMLGAEGEAWSLAQDARARWPREPGILWLLIDLAAVLEEPMLLEQLAEDIETFSDVMTPLSASRSFRVLGRTEEAVDAAELALDRAEQLQTGNGDLRTAQLELSRAYAMYASSFTDPSTQRSWASEAASLAQAVLEIDPANGGAHEILLSLCGPNGLLSDADRFRQIARHLYEHDSESRLYARIVAEEALTQGRFDQAIDRLISLYDSDPSDVNALGMLITAWARQDRLDAAEQWLNARRELRPHDPALLEHWVNTMVAMNRIDNAIDSLVAIRTTNPDHPYVTRLLERVLRTSGRHDDAFALGEKRLLSRPAGVQRDLELALLYEGIGRESDAMARLEWVADQLEHASFESLLMAIALLGRFDSSGRDRDELTLIYVNHTVEHYPASPLQVYAAGLRSLSRLGRLDGTFDTLADRAAREARIASEPTAQAALVWRDFTQAFIDDGHAAAAARALRACVLADQPLDPQALNLLAMFAIVADAVSQPSESRAARTMTLLEQLAARDRLPHLPGMEGEPTLAEALFHASRVYSILGDDRATEQLLTVVVEYRPDDWLALNNLGYMRIEAGRDDAQTVEWIEHAYDLAPDEPNIQDTIGWLRYKQGRFADDDKGEGALTLIERSRQREAEPSAEVLDHLGDVNWRLGNHDQAISLWREALALLEDSSHRRTLEENLRMLQMRGWGLLVAEPSDLYDTLYGSQIQSLRGKIEAIEAGRKPEVAPTFAELDPAGNEEPGS